MWNFSSGPLWEPWNVWVSECVCVCVRVCFLVHLSPCPPNVTAPAGGSLAYLAAGCPKPASQSDRPCLPVWLSRSRCTHTIEHQVSLCPHIVSSMVLSSVMYFNLLIYSPSLSNTPFSATSLSHLVPLSNLAHSNLPRPLVLTSCSLAIHTCTYRTDGSLSPLVLLTPLLHLLSTLLPSFLPEHA